jgi:ribosomal protein S18 acetylase RimI-like enzyme
VRASRKPGQELLDEPGLVALLGTSAELLDGRVLITDDRAAGALHDRLTELSARVVNVFAAAQRCAATLAAQAGYRPEPAAAMMHARLAAIDGPDLPAGLTIRPVCTVSPTAPGEVSLEDAAAAAMRSDPGATPMADLAGFVGYLRSVPNAHYLVATDGDGGIRATAAAAVFGSTTSVYFVNTDREWRRRGVGAAITAAALRRAAQAGAERAVLDSSSLGRSIYRRLGFQVVSETTIFLRED